MYSVDNYSMSCTRRVWELLAISVLKDVGRVGRIFIYRFSHIGVGHVLIIFTLIIGGLIDM